MRAMINLGMCLERQLFLSQGVQEWKIFVGGKFLECFLCARHCANYFLKVI